jgi:hypothetical protein
MGAKGVIALSAITTNERVKKAATVIANAL